jgi:hypothetical protein
MTNVLVTIGLAAAVALGAAGCSADDPTSAESQAALALHSENDAWNALPLGPARDLLLHASHGYGGALAARCGAPYALDVRVEFGAVTASTLAVNAVTATYVPQPGSTVVPRKLDVWSNLTADKRIPDGLPRGRGEAVRYDVTRDYQLDPRDPIVVVELETTGGVGVTDPACRRVTRFVFYPEGAPVSPP